MKKSGQYRCCLQTDDKNWSIAQWGQKNRANAQSVLSLSSNPLIMVCEKMQGLNSSQQNKFSMTVLDPLSWIFQIHKVWRKNKLLLVQGKWLGDSIMWQASSRSGVQIPPETQVNMPGGLGDPPFIPTPYGHLSGSWQARLSITGLWVWVRTPASMNQVKESLRMALAINVRPLHTCTHTSLHT